MWKERSLRIMLVTFMVLSLSIVRITIMVNTILKDLIVTNVALQLGVLTMSWWMELKVHMVGAAILGHR